MQESSSLRANINFVTLRGLLNDMEKKLLVFLAVSLFYDFSRDVSSQGDSFIRYSLLLQLMPHIFYIYY